MSSIGRGLALIVAGATSQGRRAARLRAGETQEAIGWLSQPRNAVFLFLALCLAFGGGWRWLRARRGRIAVDRLSDPDLTPEAILEVAEHGREGLLELFRLLETAPDPALRESAGRALARLWGRDELIVEEEKAIVTRGFTATWRARRRYPSGMTAPIPVSVSFGIPFLHPDASGVSAANLLWSYRVQGADRASLETFTPFAPAPSPVSFPLDPGDFPSNGPHRLIFQARVKTTGLTESWELDLPQIPFHFELDPNLDVAALLTSPDEARGAEIARALRLEPVPPPASGSRFVPLDDEFALRDPPELVVATPLPCDLAHAVFLEFEGIPGCFAAGPILLSGQGTHAPPAPGTARFPLGPLTGLPPGLFDRPGERRARAVLVADPAMGWADPEIRSIWPGELTTDWASVRLTRR